MHFAAERLLFFPSIYCFLGLFLQVFIFDLQIGR